MFYLFYQNKYFLYVEEQYFLIFVIIINLISGISAFLARGSRIENISVAFIKVHQI